MSSCTPNTGSSQLRNGFLLLAAVLLWCAIPLSPNTVDSDFWGHVQYGMDTLDHGLAQTSTYAYTSEGYRWVNHENIAEITFAWIVRHLGNAGILIFKCGLGCLVLALMMWNARRQEVSVVTTSVCAVVMAVNLSFYWGMRPQVFSFTLFAVLLTLVETRFSPQRLNDSRANRFAIDASMLLILMIVWTNSHGGFVAGVGIFGLLGVLRAFQCFLTLKDRSRLVGRLLILVALAGLATFCNPYGIRLHFWLLESLGVPRPEIEEWRAPSLFALASIKIWIMVGLIIFGIVGNAKQFDWAKCVTLTFVVIQALIHQRHLPFVAILFGFWLPTAIDHAAWKLFGSNINFDKIPKWNPIASRSIAVGLVLLSCLHAVTVGRRLQEIPVPTERFPVAAVQFMRDHHLERRVVVSGEWAQYLLGVSGARLRNDPGLRVAFDGRFRTCYPQTVVDMHFDFFRGTEGVPRYREDDTTNAARILTVGEPHLVLVKDSQKHAIGLLQQNSADWVLLYRDTTAQIWGAARRFADPSSKQYFPQERRMILPEDAEVIKGNFVAWPAAPNQATQTRLVTQPVREAGQL